MRPIAQDEVGPATAEPWASAIYFRLMSGSCSKNDLIQLEDESNGIEGGVQADASAVATAKGKLVVTVDAIASGDGSTFTALPWRLIPGVDTSGAAENDPVYLSDTAGGWSLSPGTVPRVVGRVRKVDASAGIILLDPQGALDGLGVRPVVGAITADSSVVENTVTKTDFSQTLTLPLGLASVGKTLKVRAVVRVLDNNSTDTLTCFLEVSDGTSEAILITSEAADVADDDVCVMEGWLTFRANAGAAVDVEGGGTAIWDSAAGTNGTSLPNGVTLDTTGDLTIQAAAQWSVAHADNQCILTSLTYELV